MRRLCDEEKASWLPGASIGGLGPFLCTRQNGATRTLTTKQVRETEAEAVAFVVCQSVGLQNGTASQDYIQLWHGDANLLRESLEAVQQTAAVILGGIAPEPAALAAAA
jgi:DNA transposition AAA+ family ATPase